MGGLGSAAPGKTAAAHCPGHRIKTGVMAMAQATLTLRMETPADWRAVENLTREAFAEG